MRILTSERGPLWVAMAISISVHLLILPSLKILKWHKVAPDVMTAILQPMPPLSKMPQVQAKLIPHVLTHVHHLQKRPAPRPETVQKNRRAPVKQASSRKAVVRQGHGRPGRTLLARAVKRASPAPQPDTVSASPSSAMDAGTKDASVKATVATGAAAENANDKTVKDADTKPLPDNTPPAPHRLPGRVRIDYRLQAKGYVAYAKQDWTMTDGRYHISLQGSLRFLFFQLGAMTMASDGQLDHGVPVPDRYTEDRNGHPTTVTFTTDGGIAFDQAGSQRTLKSDHQPVDLMSLAYVLAAQPSIAPGTVFTLVNRNEAEDVRLDAVVGGQINVAGRTFAVQRYVLNRLKSAGGVEIWLAPDLEVVPVSVIIRGRDGTLTMTAERIGINEPQ